MWLTFVVLAVAAMVATGTKTLQNGAVGESARGYNMLDANNLWPPPNEIAYLHSDTLTVRDPAFRSAIHDVVSRLNGEQVEIKSPLDPGGKQFVARQSRLRGQRIDLIGAQCAGQIVRRDLLVRSGTHP